MIAERMVAAGHLGRKAGRGFYAYSPAEDADSGPCREEVARAAPVGSHAPVGGAVGDHSVLVAAGHVAGRGDLDPKLAPAAGAEARRI